MMFPFYFSKEGFKTPENWTPLPPFFFSFFVAQIRLERNARSIVKGRLHVKFIGPFCKPTEKELGKENRRAECYLVSLAVPLSSSSLSLMQWEYFRKYFFFIF